MTYDVKTKKFAATDLASSLASVAAAHTLRVQLNPDTQLEDAKERNHPVQRLVGLS